MKSPKNFLIVALFVMLLCSSTIFMTFLTPSEIGTSVKSVNQSWNVKIVNISILNVEGAPSYDVPTFTNSTYQFNTIFTNVGESVSYQITIRNDGEIDAELDDLFASSINGNNDEVEVIYTAPKDTLKKGEETTLTVTAKYVNDLTNDGTPKTKLIKGVVAYKQK